MCGYCVPNRAAQNRSPSTQVLAGICNNGGLAPYAVSKIYMRAVFASMCLLNSARIEEASKLQQTSISHVLLPSLLRFAYLLHKRVKITIKVTL